MRLWMRLGIHVEAQPNWVFIKLHTHGGIEPNMMTLLEEPMRQFYEYLLSNYNDGKKYRVHFVTAREMVNMIHAAEAGCYRQSRPISRLFGLKAAPPRPHLKSVLPAAHLARVIVTERGCVGVGASRST